ncbi:ELKS/Rab6-interacting/CAST family member 1-like, partial, partial [Tachysurus ichikawai]
MPISAVIYQHSPRAGFTAAAVTDKGSFMRKISSEYHTNEIENLQEQLKDKEKQMSSLKERVKSLQTDTSNTDTALTTLEEALAEK